MLARLYRCAQFVKFLMHACSHHFRITLRLSDISMTEHPCQVLNLHALAKSERGERVAGHVRV